MGQISSKLRSIGIEEGDGYSHWCPGCESMHGIAVGQPLRNGARWSFDGNVDAPTFAPSINITIGPDSETGEIERCHYFIRAGQIEFCGDCTHALSGQTVPLPDLPEDCRD